MSARTIKLGMMDRAVTLDRKAVDLEKRTVKMTVSSEAPIRRYFWDYGEANEILSHEPDAINLARFNNGASLVVEHDGNQLVGVIESGSSEIIQKALAVVTRFSKSAEADKILNDVADGIRRNVSIRYQIDAIEKTGESDGISTLVATRWTPIHVSFVADPADYTVGPARARTADEKLIMIADNTMNSTNAQPPAPTTAPTAAPPAAPGPNIEEIRGNARTEGAQVERQRVRAIQEIADQARQRHPEVDRLAREAINDPNINADGFRQRIFQAVCNAQPVETPSSQPLGVNQRDLARYSIVRAIQRRMAGLPLDGIEAELSQETAKQTRRDPQGFFIPTDVMLEQRRYGGPGQRALETGTFSAGGALVATEMGSLIELLRNRMVTARLGARSLSGLVGNVAIPRATGGATAYWLAEGATLSASQQAVGQLALTPHNLAAATAYTKQLLAQASVDVENFVRQDLMSVIAIERDKAALQGTGTDGQPLGIVNTSGISSVTCTAIDTLTWVNMVAYETAVSNQNADVGALAFAATPTFRANAKTTFINSTGGETPLWTPQNQVNGYPAIASLQVPTASPAIFGNWADLILADWAGIDIVVDPYSLSMQGQIRIVVGMHCDSGARHAVSFVKTVLSN